MIEIHHSTEADITILFWDLQKQPWRLLGTSSWRTKILHYCLYFLVWCITFARFCTKVVEIDFSKSFFLIIFIENSLIRLISIPKWNDCESLKRSLASLYYDRLRFLKFRKVRLRVLKFRKVRSRVLKLTRSLDNKI